MMHAPMIRAIQHEEKIYNLSIFVAFGTPEITLFCLLPLSNI